MTCREKYTGMCLFVSVCLFVCLLVCVHDPSFKHTEIHPDKEFSDSEVSTGRNMCKKPFSKKHF